MEVRLTYFKPSGKYYTEGAYSSLNEYAFQVYGEVRELLKLRMLPGLIEGVHSNFIVLVEADEIAPALIIEKEAA